MPGLKESRFIVKKLTDMRVVRNSPGSKLKGRGMFDPLTHLANHYGTDKGTIEKSGDGEGDRYEPHGFTLFYNDHLKEDRFDYRNVLEIGVLDGKSMLMWKDYFPNSMIFGIDIDFDRVANSFQKLKLTRSDTSRLKFIRANQGKRDELADFVYRIGDTPFDMIIDDGSHNMDHQQISIAALFKHLIPGGKYIIEDIHTSNLEGEYRVDGENTTLHMLNTYAETGCVKSLFMDKEEMDYLNEQIEHIHIFDRKGDGKHMTCIIEKKA